MQSEEQKPSELCKLRCAPCRGDTPPYTMEESIKYLEKLGNGWKLNENKHLEKQYKFEDFEEALEFVIEVGDVSEEEGHHPDVYLSWGKVVLTIWTHKIKGLSESDFVLAAKCDARFITMFS